jgi:trans-L-3-hydroxyproline dehydratase
MASGAKQSKLEVTNGNVNDVNLEITIVDMHTGGEALRIITAGYPEIKGETILAKRQYVTENLDYIRKLLMREPRGHSEMFGALLVTPDHEQADLAVLFMHNGGYSVMCGHGVIALARYAVDSGYLTVT